MGAGDIAMAVGFSAAFTVAALLMGRSALGDWRQGRAEGDRVTQYYAVRQWSPTIAAAVLAVLAPYFILTGA